MPSHKKKKLKRFESEFVPGVELCSDSIAEHCFVNREISWLQFNLRVLTQATDSFLPLLERVRFLGIYDSNLDEFFMKRVGGLKRQVAARVGQLSPDGLTPEQQLVTIRKALEPQLKELNNVFIKEIKPRLAEEGIQLLKWDELTKADLNFAQDYFDRTVFPLLTPLSVDSGHPFPFISNLSISLAFALGHPDYEDPQFARVKVDSHLPQWVALPESGQGAKYRYLNIRDLILKNAEKLFPGMEIKAAMPFRITRNIDLEVDDEDAEDLMDAIEEELRQRRSGQVVRLEINHDSDPWILDFLTEELELKPDDVYVTDGLLDYSSLNLLLELDLPRLKFPRWVPTTPNVLAEDANIFHAIRAHDILVHHPYESFSTSVERFIKEAAYDPKVLAIKMTIYRVGQVTPLIPYLIRAADHGKQVVCLVELKARFDERHNIYWAQELEKAGVHVVYGIPGLKTHAKAILVVREDSDRIRAYAHCGTGNYHAKTSNLYTDLGLFTAREDFTEEYIHFFNYLSGRSLKNDYKKLLVAPLFMESQFIALLDQEIANQKNGLPAGIVAKMNSLQDAHLIGKLYEASKAGVSVDLIVRGVCCLRPGVPGLSENIRVISIVGRLLEHSRIFYFRNAKENPMEGSFYISSADWMARNMHRRIELAIPIEELALKEKIWDMLQVMLNDYRLAWDMQSDGYYLRRSYSPGKNPMGTHETLMAQKDSQSR